MNKKLAGLMFAGVTVFALSGCGGGGGGDTVIVDPGPEYVTLFLMDETIGLGAEFVPYTCYAPDGTIVTDDFTDAYGEFTFVAGDRCEFDLFDFAGTVPFYDHPLYIADDFGEGKDDIPYSCDNGIDIVEGITDIFGSFDYPEDAFCKFYL